MATVGIKEVARHQGFAATIGDDMELLVVTTDSLSVAAGRQAGEEIADLPAAQRPTAVFCANDLVVRESTARPRRARSRRG